MRHELNVLLLRHIVQNGLHPGEQVDVDLTLKGLHVCLGLCGGAFELGALRGLLLLQWRARGAVGGLGKLLACCVECLLLGTELRSFLLLQRLQAGDIGLPLVGLREDAL